MAMEPLSAFANNDDRKVGWEHQRYFQQPKKGPTLVPTEREDHHEKLYRPLAAGQIRLFKIDSGWDDVSKNKIELRLHTFNLATVANRYIAISYTWRDAVFGIEAREKQGSQVGVICNGRTHARATRLWPLLSRLCRDERQFASQKTQQRFKKSTVSVFQSRFKDNIVWYWIDALCINQDDDFERGHQVAQMSNIYSGASIVKAYLGMQPSAGLDRIAILNTVMRHIFWSRSWIIQEFIRSRAYAILIGAEHEISGHDFRDHVWIEVRSLELNGTYHDQVAHDISSIVN